MLFSKLIHFLDKKAILGWIISQYSGCYLTKYEKVIRKLDIFIFERIKKLSITHGHCTDIEFLPGVLDTQMIE